MLYKENDLPIVKKVLSIVNEDEDFPMFYPTLRSLLLEMGFRYMRSKHDSLLIDRDNITAWRHRYL